LFVGSDFDPQPARASTAGILKATAEVGLKSNFILYFFKKICIVFTAKP